MDGVDSRVDAQARAYVRFVCWSGALVVLWAMIHDQILVTWAPTHFTVYHPHIFDAPRLQAAACGVLASAGPGMLLGIMLYLAARRGSRPVLPLGAVLVRLGLLLLQLEALSQGAGLVARRQWAHGQLLLPEVVYPELNGAIIWSQSVNIAAYTAAPLLVAILLWRVYRSRGC